MSEYWFCSSCGLHMSSGVGLRACGYVRCDSCGGAVYKSSDGTPPPKPVSTDREKGYDLNLLTPEERALVAGGARVTTTGKIIRTIEQSKNMDFPYPPEEDL